MFMTQEESLRAFYDRHVPEGESAWRIEYIFRQWRRKKDRNSPFARSGLLCRSRASMEQEKARLEKQGHEIVKTWEVPCPAP